MSSEIDKLKSEYTYKKLILKLSEKENIFNEQLNLFKITAGIKEEERIKLTDDFNDFMHCDFENNKVLELCYINNLDLKLQNNNIKNCSKIRH